MLYSEDKPLGRNIHPMILNKLSTQLLVATLGCTLPGLVGVSYPAVAFDFQLQGTLEPSTAPAPFVQRFSSFSGIISTPGNEPISTYNGPFDINSFEGFGGQIPTFSINYYDNQGNITYTQGLGAFGGYYNGATGQEGPVAEGNRELNFGDKLTDLDLTFSPSPATPAGLSFSSGSFSFSAQVIGQLGFGPNDYTVSVIDATITPVPAPAPIGGILFLPGLAYWLLRKKR